jgi:hypothetical protein
MEYLMTYGWAILIIAVVLGVLFQLGVFNSSSLSVRAPSGGCQVFRSNGPWKTANINLVGACAGQLPQYVASISSSSQVTIPAQIANMQPQSLSMSAWVYISPNNVCFSTCTLNFFSFGSIRLFKDSDQCSTGQSSSNIEFGFEVWNGMPSPPYDGFNFNDVCGNSAGSWYNLVGTFNGISGVSNIYVNGVQITTQSITPPLNYGGATTAIVSANTGGFFQVANIQYYNTTLDSTQAKVITREALAAYR